MSGPRTKRGTAAWLGVVALVSCVLAAGAGIATFVTMSATIVPEVIWRAEDGTPVPDDFVVVMYPADDDVAVYAETDPESERIGTLERAMGNRQWELADQWIGLSLSDGGGRVRQDRLVYDTDPARRERLVAAMTATHAALGFDPFLRELRAVDAGAEPEYVARTEWSGGSWLESHWRVIDGGAGFEPLTVTMWHEQTVAMQGMAVVVMSAVAAGAMFLASAMLGTVVVLAVRMGGPDGG